MSSGMDVFVDFAERHQFVARVETENCEHRMRPEDASAREVPVPQSAASAIERGIDAAADGVIDEVGLARACRLPVEGEAEDQQHEAGGGGQCDGQRGVGAPGRERIAAALIDQRAGRAVLRACERWQARVCCRRARCPHARAGAENGLVAGIAQNVDEPAADEPGRVRARRR